MCRNIKTLFNFEPPATELEIRDASLQFVRKLSGFNGRPRPTSGVRARGGRGRRDARVVIASLVTTRRAARPRGRSAEGQGALGAALRAARMSTPAVTLRQPP